MGINVRMDKRIKPTAVKSYEVSLEKDLKDCMKCKFFFGNNSQCIKEKCCKEQEIMLPKLNTDSICFECPYKKDSGYCFPCMKKLLGMTKGDSA